jgi:hypothetical protein
VWRLVELGYHLKDAYVFEAEGEMSTFTDDRQCKPSFPYVLAARVIGPPIALQVYSIKPLKRLVLPFLVSHRCKDLLHPCDQFPIARLIVPRNVAFYGFRIRRAEKRRRDIVVLAREL